MSVSKLIQIENYTLNVNRQKDMQEEIPCLSTLVKMIESSQLIDNYMEFLRKIMFYLEQGVFKKNILILQDLIDFLRNIDLKSSDIDNVFRRMYEEFANIIKTKIISTQTFYDIELCKTMLRVTKFAIENNNFNIYEHEEIIEKFTKYFTFFKVFQTPEFVPKETDAKNYKEFYCIIKALRNCDITGHVFHSISGDFNFDKLKLKYKWTGAYSNSTSSFIREFYTLKVKEFYNEHLYLYTKLYSKYFYDKVFQKASNKKSKEQNLNFTNDAVIIKNIKNIHDLCTQNIYFDFEKNYAKILKHFDLLTPFAIPVILRLEGYASPHAISVVFLGNKFVFVTDRSYFAVSKAYTLYKINENCRDIVLNAVKLLLDSDLKEPVGIEKFHSIMKKVKIDKLFCIPSYCQVAATCQMESCLLPIDYCLRFFHFFRLLLFKSLYKSNAFKVQFNFSNLNSKLNIAKICAEKTHNTMLKHLKLFALQRLVSAFQDKNCPLELPRNFIVGLYVVERTRSKHILDKSNLSCNFLVEENLIDVDAVEQFFKGLWKERKKKIKRFIDKSTRWVEFQEDLASENYKEFYYILEKLSKQYSRIRRSNPSAHEYYNFRKKVQNLVRYIQNENCYNKGAEIYEFYDVSPKLMSEIYKKLPDLVEGRISFRYCNIL